MAPDQSVPTGSARCRSLRCGLVVGLLAISGLALFVSGQGEDDVAELMRCEGREFLSAPESADPGQQRSVPDTDAIREIHRWSKTRDGYESFWSVDGWVHVGVASDVEVWQGALDERFPGVAVRAMEVPFLTVELEAVRDRAVQVIQDATADGSWGSFAREQIEPMPEVSLAFSAPTHYGMAQIHVDVLTPQRLGLLDEFRGEPICFGQLRQD